jgi:hypothetical protein
VATAVFDSYPMYEAMCRLYCGLRFIVGILLLILFAAGALAQQVAAPVGEDDQNEFRKTGILTVTVSDETGGVIPNAVVVLLRVSRGRAVNTTDFSAELWTGSNGQVTTDVPCGRGEVFVEAPFFNPQAEMVSMERKSFVSVRLKIDAETNY